MANTGLKIYQDLEEFNSITGIATGNTKPNVDTDPDYIAPVQDLTLCPLPSVPFDVFPKNISLGAESSNQIISVDGDFTWSISSLPTWLTSSKGLSGTGNFTLTTTDNNNSTERSFSVLITANGINKTIEITQNKPSSNIKIIPESKNVTSNGTSYNIDVTSPFGWSATISSSWVTANILGSFGDDIMTVTVSTNNTTNNRTATITFTESTNNTTVIHQLTQNADAGASFFSHNVVFATSPRDACDGFGTSMTVYSASSFFGNATQLFTNNTLATPVNSGYYQTGQRVLLADSNGNVIESVDCPTGGGF